MYFKVIACLVLVLVLALTQGVPVYAEDTEVLLNVYGMTLGKPIKHEIESEIQSLENTIDNVRATQHNIEQRNAMINVFNEQMQKKADSILNNVVIYQNKSEQISKNISSNLLDGDIRDLLRYDAEYKNNAIELEQLLNSLGDYYIDYSYSFINSDLTDIEKELATAKVLYIESLDTFNLGDVTNVKFPIPVSRYITSDFGYRIDPLKKDIIAYHSGTDYRCPTGTPVYALFNGEVTSCGWSDTSGNFITVRCGENIKYFVCHLSEILVTEGQHVDQYDTIALSGGTGSRCTGPHLHLGLYINGVAQNVDELFKYAENKNN